MNVDDTKKIIQIKFIELYYSNLKQPYQRRISRKEQQQNKIGNDSRKKILNSIQYTKR